MATLYRTKNTPVTCENRTLDLPLTGYKLLKQPATSKIQIIGKLNNQNYLNNSNHSGNCRS